MNTILRILAKVFIVAGVVAFLLAAWWLIDIYRWGPYSALDFPFHVWLFGL